MNATRLCRHRSTVLHPNAGNRCWGTVVRVYRSSDPTAQGAAYDRAIATTELIAQRRPQGPAHSATHRRIQRRFTGMRLRNT